MTSSPTKAMKIGVRIPGAGPKASPAALLKTARWAQALGFHSLWVSDHVALPEPDVITSAFPYGQDGRWPFPADSPWLDPLLTLLSVAGAAPSLSLGTSVLVAPLRHPVLLAKQVASLDYLSGGRVILGLGAGWLREEFDLMGIPYARRGARAAEMVTLMRALWTGTQIDHQGEFYRAQAVTMSPRPAQAHLPVVWGGHSEHALRRVVTCGDGWHPTQLTLEQLAAGIDRLRALCGEHGRDPSELTIIARPGPIYRLDAASHARHVALGVDHVVIDPPLGPPDDDDLSGFRTELERVAALCQLSPRAL